MGVEKEIDMLKSNLEAIRIVLTDAERKQVKQETIKTIKLWIEK